MVALRDIDPGTEVTFNYLTTEWDMSAPFHCDCGALHCPGWVAGYRHLSLRQRRAIAAIVCDHLRYPAGVRTAPPARHPAAPPVRALTPRRLRVA
jgi:hypothetical protein